MIASAMSPTEDPQIGRLIGPEQMKQLEQLFSRSETSFAGAMLDGEHDNSTTSSDSFPLEHVEFELKHAKEYMAKLKFNLLELTSKRVFLDKLMPSGTLTSADLMISGNGGTVAASAAPANGNETLSLYDEWTNCQTRWSPGDLKELERRVETKKGELKTVKETVMGIKEEIANVAGHVVALRTALDADRDAGLQKLRQISRLETDIHALQGQLEDLAGQVRRPAGLLRCDSCEDSGSVVGQMLGIRSVEELRGELDELAIGLERRAAALSSHRTTVAELDRLCTHHNDDLLKLRNEEARLCDILAVKQQEKEQRAEAALEQLCVWYRAAIEAVGDVTRMKFEMIRPDYILVTLRASASGDSDSVSTMTTIPVHLTVDPQTARLLAAQVGSTSATPKHGWKELCVQAVENNDICSLLHALQHRL